MFFIFCVIYAKDKNARVNYDYADVTYTIYGQLKMLFSHFQKFELFNFKMIFAKTFMKKGRFLWQISKVIIKFYYLTKFYFIICKLKKYQILNFLNFFNIRWWLMYHCNLKLNKLLGYKRRAVKNVISGRCFSGSTLWVRTPAVLGW